MITALLSPDVVCQVVGLRGCSHVFDSACLINIILGGVIFSCPLCKTEWFNPVRIDQPTARHREIRVSRLANLLQGKFFCTIYLLLLLTCYMYVNPRSCLR
jgi:hypothetical protein